MSKLNRNKKRIREKPIDMKDKEDLCVQALNTSEPALKTSTTWFASRKGNWAGGWVLEGTGGGKDFHLYVF